MEALLKSEKALDILTTISLAQFLVIVVFLIGIGVLIYKFKDSIHNYLEDYRNKENRKEDWKQMVERHEKEIIALKKHHEEDIKVLREHHEEDMDNFERKQQMYRKQSLDKQTAIDGRFGEINDKIDSLTQLISNHYEETKRLKRNELREKLLNSYNHYTSLELNPKQEWNEMEAEAFWHIFKDYEVLGGNGFMHNTVKPAMEKLKVISI